MRAAAGSVKCHGEVATIVRGDGAQTINGTKRADVIVSGNGGDVIYGNGGDDVICGQNGGDLIHGGDGNDQLYGGDDGYDPGADGYRTDQFWGDAGNDTIVPGVQYFMANTSAFADRVHYEHLTHAIEVHGRSVFGEGHDMVFGAGINGTVYDDVMDAAGTTPAYYFGGEGNDQLTGGPGADILIGDNGDDQLRAGGSSDYLNAGREDYYYYHDLNGEDGDDFVSAGDGDDRVVVITGSDHVVGGWGDDSIVAFSGNGLFEGGPGDDRIYAGVGSDTVVGGPNRAGDVCFQTFVSTSQCEFVRYSFEHNGRLVPYRH
jgi:Ca2+-binding RTX toxin-like protein